MGRKAEGMLRLTYWQHRGSVCLLAQTQDLNCISAHLVPGTQEDMEVGRRRMGPDSFTTLTAWFCFRYSSNAHSALGRNLGGLERGVGGDGVRFSFCSPGDRDTEAGPSTEAVPGSPLLFSTEIMA